MFKKSVDQIQFFYVPLFASYENPILIEIFKKYLKYFYKKDLFNR